MVNRNHNLANDIRDQDKLYEDPPMEFGTKTPCPSCGEDLYFIYYRTKISYENAIEIETYFCKKCLYKSTTTIPLDILDEKKISFKVLKQSELRTIVYRSQEASVEIPEFGIRIDPGEGSQGGITTVEGILQDVLEKLDLFNMPEDDSEKVSELRAALEGILGGTDRSFTVIIYDPLGKSRISSPRAMEEKHP